MTGKLTEVERRVSKHSRKILLMEKRKREEIERENKLKEKIKSFLLITAQPAI